jgi:hypothetical protein
MILLLILVLNVGWIVMHAMMAAPGLGRLSVAFDIVVYMFSYLVVKWSKEQKDAEAE